MPVTVAVLVVVAGVLVAVAAIGIALWSLVDRPLRVAAWGGVVGREGRGVLLRDGDGLVFVRRARRYVLPLVPEPDGALRRSRRVPRSGGPPRDLVADVFRGPDHVVHTVAIADDRRAARVLEPDPFRRRITPLSFVPPFAAAVLALGVVLTVPSLAVWVSAITVDGTILPVDPKVMTFGLIGVVGSVLGLSLLVARGVRTMRRRPVILWPMTASVPGFAGSAPDAERYHARLLPLRELARAVELREGHGDVEDNDLFRSRGRALWTVLREPVLLGVVLVPFSGLYSAAVMQSVEYGALTAVLSAVLGLVLAARRGQRAWGRVSEPDGWRTWERASAWRRPDGQVAVVLFDDAGGAVWSIPVDRVFAADARVEIGDVLHRDQFPAVRANGVRLLACGPAELVSPGLAVGMRHDLIWALTGPRATASAPLT